MENTLNSIWLFVNIPDKDEFVLISDGPLQDGPESQARSKNKEELVEKGIKMKTKVYSFVRIYNDKLQIVWDAFLQSTSYPGKEAYDPEYWMEIISKR